MSNGGYSSPHFDPLFIRIRAVMAAQSLVWEEMRGSDSGQTDRYKALTATYRTLWLLRQDLESRKEQQEQPDWSACAD